MIYTYKPQGVCSTQIVYDIENGIIKKLEVYNGCNGNLKGIASLVEGMSIDEVIKKLRGIKCGMKQTSCPDQIARGLEDIKKNKM